MRPIRRPVGRSGHLATEQANACWRIATSTTNSPVAATEEDHLEDSEEGDRETTGPQPVGRPGRFPTGRLRLDG